MCRFLAYIGRPILLDDLIYAPSHSLVHQSLHANEAKTVTNGDGFGLGWYGQRDEPGLYREILPAWSDENLKSLSSQICSQLFFAHVRASTGSALSRANCHPFKYGKTLFMHNGQIGGYDGLRRKIEILLPDELYAIRNGTTDSELIFLLALSFGLEERPYEAMGEALSRIHGIMASNGVASPLRFTACFTDGARVWAYRWASDGRAPSLYFRKKNGGIIVVSEPIDNGEEEDWCPVPQDTCLLVDDFNTQMLPLNAGERLCV